MIYRFFRWLLGPDHRVEAQIAEVVVYCLLATAILFVVVGEIYMAAVGA